MANYHYLPRMKVRAPSKFSGYCYLCWNCFAVDHFTSSLFHWYPVQLLVTDVTKNQDLFVLPKYVALLFGKQQPEAT